MYMCAHITISPDKIRAGLYKPDQFFCGVGDVVCVYMCVCVCVCVCVYVCVRERGGEGGRGRERV